MSYFVEHKTYPYYVGDVTTLTAIPHIHTHLEMVFLVEGEVVAYCDRKEYAMERGDLFVAFPNQIHSYRTKEPLRAFVMIFSPSLSPLLEKLLSGRIPACCVVKKERIGVDSAAVLSSVLAKKRSGDPYQKLGAMGEFLSFLAEVLPLFDYEEDSADYDSMQKILTYLSEHFTEEITLELLSQKLFLNKYYISHLFRKRMEMSFHDFLSFLRINRACELLQKNDSITQVALSAGFSSVRTFNRVFRQVMDMTPARYRKEQK